ncbi:MAG TPA: twin-arginine translocase TatA/TatE family subunit [Alphaproteobacteria bacterium]|nr:twin-arginine translocase TatA/TatE family subunit [Alphaproteobacteria bacterium]
MNIGFTEAIVLLVIVLILFGAGKLPKVMGDLGKGIKNFKSGLKDAEAEEAAAEPGRLPDASATPAAPAPAAGLGAKSEETKVG